MYGVDLFPDQNESTSSALSEALQDSGLTGWLNWLTLGGGATASGFLHFYKKQLGDPEMRAVMTTSSF